MGRSRIQKILYLLRDTSNSKPIIHKTFDYVTDWNASIIFSVAKHILNQKGLNAP
jgi:hypothetical protein